MAAHRSPFAYGGKSKLAERIAALLPEYIHYEVFGGQLPESHHTCRRHRRQVNPVVG